MKYIKISLVCLLVAMVWSWGFTAPIAGTVVTTRMLYSDTATVTAANGECVVTLPGIFTSYRILLTPQDPVPATAQKWVPKNIVGNQFTIHITDAAGADVDCSVTNVVIDYMVFRNSGE